MPELPEEPPRSPISRMLSAVTVALVIGVFTIVCSDILRALLLLIVMILRQSAAN